MARNLHSSSDSVSSSSRRTRSGEQLLLPVTMAPLTTSPSNPSSSKHGSISASAHALPSRTKSSSGSSSRSRSGLRKERSFTIRSSDSNNQQQSSLSSRKCNSERKQRSILRSVSDSNKNNTSNARQPRRRRDSPSNATTETTTTTSASSILEVSTAATATARSVPARSRSSTTSKQQQQQQTHSSRHSTTNTSMASIPDLLYSPSCSDSTLESSEPEISIMRSAHVIHNHNHHNTSSGSARQQPRSMDSGGYSAPRQQQQQPRSSHDSMDHNSSIRSTRSTSTTTTTTAAAPKNHYNNVHLHQRRGTAAPTPVAALFTPSTPKTRDMIALGDALSKQQAIMNQTTVVPIMSSSTSRPQPPKTPVEPYFRQPQGVSELLLQKKGAQALPLPPCVDIAKPRLHVQMVPAASSKTDSAATTNEGTHVPHTNNNNSMRQARSALKTPTPTGQSPRAGSPLRSNHHSSPIRAMRRLVGRGKSTSSSSRTNSSNSHDHTNNSSGFFQLKKSVSAPPLVMAPGPAPLEKQVRFVVGPPVVHIRTALSEREEANLYWSKKQVKQMLIRVQTMARDAWDQDRTTLLTCIHACYGFESQLKSSQSNINPHSTAMAAHSKQAKQLASSPQMALHYFCHYQALDPLDVGGVFYDAGGLDAAAAADAHHHDTTVVQKYLLGANSDHYPMILHDDDYQQEPVVPDSIISSPVNEELVDDNITLSTLRGLERHLSFAIVDYQMQCIHAVLKAQSQLRGDEASPRQLAAGIAKQASHNSLPARKFARLLGKADAALIGAKNSSNSSKTASSTTSTVSTVASSDS